MGQEAEQGRVQGPAQPWSLLEATRGSASHLTGDPGPAPALGAPGCPGPCPRQTCSVACGLRGPKAAPPHCVVHCGAVPAAAGHPLAQEELPRQRGLPCGSHEEESGPLARGRGGSRTVALGLQLRPCPSPDCTFNFLG